MPEHLGRLLRLIWTQRILQRSHSFSPRMSRAILTAPLFLRMQAGPPYSDAKHVDAAANYERAKRFPSCARGQLPRNELMTHKAREHRDALVLSCIRWEFARGYTVV